MITYRYKANNFDSYQSLATYIAPNMDVQATFFPLNYTIVIAFQGEDDPEIEFVADHINDNALDFQTSPVNIHGVETAELLKTDLNPASLRDLITREIQNYESQIFSFRARCEAVEQKLETERKLKEDHYNYWLKALDERDNIKKQIHAISTLLAPLAK